MSEPLILASGSSIRAQLLANAGIEFEIEKARVDEDSAKRSLQADGAIPRDIADALAELKASRVSAKFPERWVLGCDQVLKFEGRLLSKPTTPEEAKAQLSDLSGRRHQLLSAAVIFENNRPIWRHVGTAQLQVRELSRTYIASYVSEYWDEIRNTVGCYRIEEEGVRLFSRIEGDYFSILGLPLLELQAFLALRGKVAT
jgi:septum formation protein